ncbi:MAG: hypothetical protein HQ518_30610 [Rhodopirellula sp.]|nr:hypothetical protein [Rhodopirellula sp.]
MSDRESQHQQSLASCCYDAVKGWVESPSEADFPREWERNLIASGFQEAIDQTGGQFALGKSQRLRVHYEIENSDSRLAEDFRRELVLALVEMLSTGKPQVERSLFRRFYLVVSSETEQTEAQLSSSSRMSPSAETNGDQSHALTVAGTGKVDGLPEFQAWLTQPPDAFRGLPQAVEAIRRLRAARRELIDAVLPRFQLLLDSLAGHSLDTPEENLELARMINQERAAFNLQFRVKGPDPVPVYLNTSLAARAKRVTFQAISADKQRRSIIAKTTFPPLEAFLPETNDQARSKRSDPPAADGA